MSAVMYVEFQCSKCESKDTIKLFPGESAPQALNCWNCGAGREYGPGHIHQQVFDKVGMLPIPDDKGTGAIN